MFLLAAASFVAQHAGQLAAQLDGEAAAELHGAKEDAEAILEVKVPLYAAVSAN